MTPIICRLFDVHIIILQKYLPQKDHSTVDWARWRNNRGSAPRSFIEPRTC